MSCAADVIIIKLTFEKKTVNFLEEVKCSEITVFEKFGRAFVRRYEKPPKKKICVIGCGGLGGHIIETMARIGVLHITAVDDDVFDVSNLNRQLLSSERVIGRLKAEVAKERVAEINSEVYVNAITERLNDTNANTILKGQDLAFDALDSIQARLTLADSCTRLGIPLVHGSIAGWYGQAASVFPGDETLQMVYGNTGEKGVERTPGNLPFVAQATAAFQCSEAVKILTGRGEPLRNALLSIDFLNNDFYVIKLGNCHRHQVT